MNIITNETLSKPCKTCERILPADVVHFRKKKGGKLGFEAHCKECLGIEFGIHQMNRTVKAKKGYKFCGKCKNELPADINHFYKSKSRKDGLDSWCKKCWGSKDYGVKQPNKVFDTKDGYKICASCREELPYKRFSKNTDNKDKRSSSCKACASIKGKEYDSRPEVKKRAKAYAKEWRKGYYATDHGKAMNLKHINIRRSRKENTIYNYSESVWIKTLEVFDHACAYCGDTTSDLHQEHVIPLSKGGYYTKENIIPACQFCNSSKHARDLDEWYPKQSCFSPERLKKINEWAGIDSNNTQQLKLV